MYKNLGIAIWGVSYLVFLWIALTWANVDIAMIGILFIALFVYLPMLLFNWLFGQQKGHLGHFLMIIISLPLALAMLFRDEIGTVAFGIVTIAFCVSGYLIVRKYRKKFVDDAKRRVARDHFKGKQQIY